MSNLVQWYEKSGVKLPWDFGSVALSFTANSLGIVRSIINDEVSVTFSSSSLVKTAGALALADRDSKRIVVDCDILSGAACGQEVRSELGLQGATVGDVIAIVHGTVFHETLHFLLSPNHLTDFLKPGMKFNNTFGFIANVVEDVYIENEGVRRYPNFGWMISDVWTLLFDPKRIIDIQKKWGGDAPKNVDELQNALNTLCMYKNQGGPFHTRTDFEREMRRILFSVHGVNELDERIEIVYKLYAFVTQAMKKDAEKEEEANTGEVKGSGRNDEEEGFEGEGEFGEGDEKDFGTIESPFLSPSDLTASEKESKFFIGRDIDTSITVLQDVEKVGKTPVFVSVLKAENKAAISFDERWLAFAKLTNARSTVRRVVGSPRFSGRRITAPQNLIVTDDPSHYGKVFSSATMEATSQRSGSGKPQVLILVDLSGSMANGFGDCKLAKALRAAYGALCGLEKAGISASVLGFTTLTNNLHSDEITHIINYKKFSESFSTGKGRVSGHYHKLLTSLCRNNTDSVAIEYAARQFVGNGTKILVVISDGHPGAMMYRDVDDGIAKTSEVVKKVRKNGINVFSVAIDERAVSSCKRIYGDKDALISDDPNVIVDRLSKLL